LSGGLPSGSPGSLGSPFPELPSPKSSSPGMPSIEPCRSSSAVLSELRLLVFGVARGGMCVPNAMPGIVPAFLVFQVF